jgi:hypothetical protein
VNRTTDKRRLFISLFFGTVSYVTVQDFVLLPINQDMANLYEVASSFCFPAQYCTTRQLSHMWRDRAEGGGG